jgi:AraC-like DNA-binding protein
MVAAARRATDGDALVEQAIVITSQALAQVGPQRVAAGRPSTVRARRALVTGARELLAHDPGRSIVDLARELAVSPHHLSRTFRAGTGHTISRHRMRLCVRSVLERLAGGERDLARLAADVGLADQSHLCRVVRRETGQVPSALRSALAPGRQNPVRPRRR